MDAIKWVPTKRTNKMLINNHISEYIGVLFGIEGNAELDRNPELGYVTHIYTNDLRRSS